MVDPARWGIRDVLDEAARRARAPYGHARQGARRANRNGVATAANASFCSLPLLASVLARDNYLPHVFALRDDRQVFAPGIGVLSAVLLIAVGGNTQALIPLFAIGVFTGFTLSQARLAAHWRRARPAGWRYRAVLDGVGAAGRGWPPWCS